MDLAGAVRELYALGPGEFIGARDRLARAARSDGDKDRAEALKRLKKPSAGAWLANMLALHRQADLLPVLELGAAMREAQDQLDGDELRQLGRERAGVIGTALDAARQVADQLGQPSGPAAVADVEQTLRAALNDTEAAAAVASGQLVRGLAATGLGPVDLDGALADPASVPPAPALPSHRLRPVAKPPPRRTRPTTAAEPDSAAPARPDADRERQEQQRAAAQQQVDDARAASEAVDGELAEARADVTRTAAEYERIAARLSALRERVATLDRQAKDARRARRDAEQHLRRL